MNSKTIVIPEIPSDRKYWLIRTESGNYYRDFKANGFIAIGWNDFADIKELEDAIATESKEKLLGKFKKIYPKEKRPGLAVNQMIKFVNNLSIGDVVIIPSTKGNEISIGEITSDPYIEYPKPRKSSCLEMDKPDYQQCPYFKRMNVKWLTSIRKNKLDLQLSKLLNARNTITNADNYSHFIDRSIYDIYVKDGLCHLTLYVTKQEDISVGDFGLLLSSAQDLVNESNLPTHKKRLTMKSRVESPGPIEFMGSAAVISMILAGIYISYFGGSIKINIPFLGIEFEFTTKGYHGYKQERLNEENRHKEFMLMERHRHEEEMYKHKSEEFKKALDAMSIYAPKTLDK